MPGISLTLIVPVFNEEALIEKALEKNLAVLEKSGIDYELLVIDDGSTDNSVQIIQSKFGNLPKLKIFLKRKNEGLGSAIQKGIELAAKPFITFMPADSPLSDGVLNSFTENIKKADILVGYRKDRKGYSLRMKLNSKVYHWLISTLFSLNLKDYNWVHLYRKSIFEQGGIEISSKGIFMLAEVLVKANWSGMSIYEFPVEYTERESGVPTASSFKAVFKTAKDAFRFYFDYVLKGKSKVYRTSKAYH